MIGFDEVGRGAWAGPLLVACVQLDNGVITDLQDSKLTSFKQRARLSVEIKLHAKQIGLGWVSSEVVDRLGLTKSLILAAEYAFSYISNTKDSIVIDGNVNWLPGQINSKAIVRADQQIEAVQAASIIAKQARDSYMALSGLKHPSYGFESHVGYGTARHRMALEAHGPCSEHRLSFKPVALIAKERSDENSRYSRRKGG